MSAKERRRRTAEVNLRIVPAGLDTTIESSAGRHR